MKKGKTQGKEEKEFTLKKRVINRAGGQSCAEKGGRSAEAESETTFFFFVLFRLAQKSADREETGAG